MVLYNLTPDLVIVQVRSLGELQRLALRHTDSEKQSQEMSSSFWGPRTGCLCAVLLGLISGPSEVARMVSWTSVQSAGVTFLTEPLTLTLGKAF